MIYIYIYIMGGDSISSTKLLQKNLKTEVRDLERVWSGGGKEDIIDEYLKV